jgi:hypothetical protein
MQAALVLVQILETLELLYEKMQQQVCIGGEMGRLFETYAGTKQGTKRA